jgi:hypothetical protein
MDCITNVITDNLDTEKQLVLVVLLSTTISVMPLTMDKPTQLTPQSTKVKAIVAKYAISKSTGYDMLAGLKKCVDNLPTLAPGPVVPPS